MKTEVLLIVPTKDGGEGFVDLVKSIEKGVQFALDRNLDLSFEIVFAINGDPEKPLRYLDVVDPSGEKIKRFVIPKPGKVHTINYVLERIDARIYITLDDDIRFGPSLIYDAIVTLIENEDILLTSYQTKALPYSSRNQIRRFLYDVINIRSLKGLYKGGDPFLFGRFLAFRKGVFRIPSDTILEDLYLSVVLDGRYRIGNDLVYYRGLGSLAQHIRRVILLETGRAQVRSIFPAKYDVCQRKNKRVIDTEKVRSLSLYYRICYTLYKVLRFFTNRIIARMVRHNTVHW